MSDKKTPNWHTIERLPLIASHIDGMTETATEHYATLQEALPKPYILDDYTINRVIGVFTTQKEDLPLFDEQLGRWKAGKLTSRQSQEVDRLITQLSLLRQTITKILELANELKKGTIEQQLAKSDLQLGLESLLEPRSKPKGQ